VLFSDYPGKRCFHEIARHPKRWKRVFPWRNDVRSRHCGRHYVFYLMEQPVVFIAVLHDRTNLMERLKDRL